MKPLSISSILLLLVLFFTGCDKKKPDPTPVTPAATSTAVKVSEGGAPPYVLKETQVTTSQYQSSRASFTLAGKLIDGTQLTVSFKQSTPTVGANLTDAVTATMNGTSIATQASGTTTRNPDTNAVSGSFSCTFPSGLKVDGLIDGLPL